MDSEPENPGNQNPPCGLRLIGGEPAESPGAGGFGGGNFQGGGVRRAIDEETLMAIADVTGGTYHLAESADELHAVFQNLPTTLIMRHEVMEISVIFAGLGALLVALAILLGQLWRPCRRRRVRPSSRGDAPAGHPAVSPSTSMAAERLPPYLLRRSPRSRGLRVVVDPMKGLVVSVPPASRRGWAHPEPMIERFLREREPWVRRHLDRLAGQRAEMAARGGVRDGATIRYRGELHVLRVLPASPGARRSTVTREGGLEADELVVRTAASDHRPIRRDARRLVPRASPLPD